MWFGIWSVAGVGTVVSGVAMSVSLRTDRYFVLLVVREPSKGRALFPVCVGQVGFVGAVVGA